MEKCLPHRELPPHKLALLGASSWRVPAVITICGFQGK